MNQRAISFLFAIGRPFSPLYSAAMRLRALLYRHRIFASRRFEVPVISVGNLTMGGTGKTPLVIYIARYLLAKGLRPGIVSRGYKAKGSQSIAVVSNGNELLLDPGQAGDEPYLMARRVPEAVVAIGKRRAAVCQMVIDRFGCNVLVLDDGFQHLAVQRALDLVLFDADHFAGTSRVFPGGELREPVSALRRCNAFVLTGVTEENHDRADRCGALLATKFKNKPVIRSTRTYCHAIRYEMNDNVVRQSVVAVAHLEQLKLACFCAIARPERFRRMLLQHRIAVMSFLCLADHYCYTRDTLDTICRQADQEDADGLLTTEKDMTKIVSLLHDGCLPIYVPIMDIPTISELDSLIDSLLL